MKQHYFKLLAVLLALTFFSCERELEELQPKLDTQELSLVEAKQLFESTIVNRGTYEQNTEHQVKRQKLSKTPEWSRAFTKNMFSRRTVVVPLTLPNDVSYQLEDGTYRSLNGNVYMLLYKGTDGTMHTEVVTKIPDSAYVNSTDKEKRFSGVVYVEDWEGNLVKGFEVKKDKVRPLLSLSVATKPENKVELAPGGLNATTTSLSVWCQTTTWYSCTYFASNPNIRYCSELYSEERCWGTWDGGSNPDDSAYWEEDGGGSGGGSGSSGSGGDAVYVVSIDDTNLAPCMQPIMTQLTSLTMGVGQIVAKFAGNTPGFNWEVKNGTLGAGVNGTTSSVYNRLTGTVTTTFDSNKFTNASDLSVARTVLHESVHAYIVAYFRSDYANAQKEFADLYDDFLKNRYPDDNDAQHIEIARNYVNDIALALQEYGIMQGYSLSSQFYQDLAWGGLTHWPKKDALGNVMKDALGNTIYEETPWFLAAYTNATDRARVINTALVELTGKDSNGNTTPKGGSNVGC